MRLALAAALAISFNLMAADSFEGSWKLNVEKSQLLPTIDIASETITIVRTGPASFKTVTAYTTKSGQRRYQETSRITDGNEHSIDRQGMSEIVERPSRSTRKVTGKRDGRQVIEIVSTVSPDGQVMTIHRTSGAGEENLIFEKH